MYRDMGTDIDVGSLLYILGTMLSAHINNLYADDQALTEGLCSGLP